MKTLAAQCEAQRRGFRRAHPVSPPPPAYRRQGVQGKHKQLPARQKYAIAIFQQSVAIDSGICHVMQHQGAYGFRGQRPRVCAMRIAAVTAIPGAQPDFALQRERRERLRLAHHRDADHRHVRPGVADCRQMRPTGHKYAARLRRLEPCCGTGLTLGSDIRHRGLVYGSRMPPRPC